MGPYHVETNVTVRRGFPLRARARIAPAEPDVGLPMPYISDLQLTTLLGKDINFLLLNADELHHVEEQIWRDLNSSWPKKVDTSATTA